MAVEINTKRGNVIVTSDVAFLERNVIENHPIGLFYNLWECYEAYKKINKRADFIFTSHDPDLLLKKFPDGKI